MIQSKAYTIVSASATPLVIGDTVTADGMTLWIHNHDHQASHEIYLGDATVSSSTGFHLDATLTIGPIGLAPGEVIYATSSEQDGVALRILATRT